MNSSFSIPAYDQAMKDFGRRMRVLRQRKGMPLEDFAVASHVPWAALAAIEAGKRFPSLYELERLLDYLQMTLNDIMSVEAG